MSAGLTIRADGVEWPLETYLDARGFIRTNGEVPDFCNAPGTLDAVTYSGELRQGVEVTAIPWHATLAVAIPQGSMKLARCPGCDAWVVPVAMSTDGKGHTVLTSDICNTCEEDCY